MRKLGLNGLVRPNSDHLRIVRGILLVATFVLIGKLVGAGKEVVIAYKYGVGPVLDIYLLSLTFATWLPVVWASVLNTVYVPLIHSLTPQDGKVFTAEITGMTLVLAGTLTLTLAIVLPHLITAFASDLDAEAAQSLRTAAAALAPVAGFGLLIAQLSVQLLAAERHANTLYEVIPSLTLMLVILLLPSQGSISPLLIGTVLGIALQLLGLAHLLLRSRSLTRPVVRMSSKGWSNFRQAIGIMVFSQFVISFNEPISNVIAAQLGEGNISKLGYTTRILALFMGLGATSISRAILPVLSSTSSSAKQRIRLALQWALLLLGGGILCTALCWVLAPYIVRLLLERGAFTTEDTTSVVAAIRLGVYQFPFYFSGIVLVQLCASFKLYKAIFISSCIALFTKTLFSLILVKHLSYAGIVLATTPMYFATAAFFFYFVLTRSHLFHEAAQKS